jgi:predicted transcriptional regulator
MDMQAEKLGLIQSLAQLTDQTMIAKIKALGNEKADWWHEIIPEEKAEIEEGLLQGDKGEVKPHSEIRTKYKKWQS